MPLTERDANAQHNNPRNKRHSMAFQLLPGSENAAPSPDVPKTKTTPAGQQRFLAPTKASNAKTTSPTLARKVLQPHSGRSTPQPLPHKPLNTKVPLKGAAVPAIVPPISKWSLREATHSNLDQQKSLSTSKSSPLLMKAADIAQVQSSVSSHDVTKTRPSSQHEKPLPPRPFATSVNGPSPSKDSRSLLDATEKPLRLTVDGVQRDWPALTPSSSTASTMGTPGRTLTPDNHRPFSPSGRRSSSNTSMIPVVSAYPRAFNPHPSRALPSIPGARVQRCSSLLSYASTLDEDQSVETTTAPNGEESRTGEPMTRQSMLTPPSHPPRKSSLRDLPSSGSLNADREVSATDTSPSLLTDNAAADDLRPSSPYTANFSRLRPSSLSHTAGSALASTATTPSKFPKTASRIPLPDSKKANLVDIKTRRSSGIPIPKVERGLNFNGRRIDSPDPLKVLDHGIRRRQNRRTDNHGSTSTASTVPTKVLNFDSASRSQSKASFPGSTTGESSDDEEEVTTPSEKPRDFLKHSFRPKHLNRTSGSHYGGATLKVYDEAEVVLGRPPPSNSPFTGPLQTIHSQSTLPMGSFHSRESSEGKHTPRVVLKPTEFTTFANRLSELQSVYGNTARHSRARFSVLSTRSELVDVLHQAEHEDALISQCGALGLDTPTKQDISATLSMLEGTAGPAVTAIDPEKLAHMLGRLRLGFEKAPKSAAFIEDATTAERFLELGRRGSTASEAVKRVIKAKANGESRNFSPCTNDDPNEDDDASHHSQSRTVASKWSNSTSSDRDLSMTLVNNDINHHTDDYDGHLPALAAQSTSFGSAESIGYPSRVNGKAQRVLGSDERSTATQKTGSRRISSPTLGKRVPGSVRVARAKANAVTGYATSRNAISDKITTDKKPTLNTKPLGLSSSRGRTPSAEKLHRISAQPKTPRSQSKSRYVLDKINGLFSGKRAQRDAAPPVPPLKEYRTQQLIGTTHVKGSSMGSNVTLARARSPPLTKFPTTPLPNRGGHPVLPSATPAHSLVSTSAAATPAVDINDYTVRDSVHLWTERLTDHAAREPDDRRKERLLSVAQVLNQSLIHARDAAISAETAQSAARRAGAMYELTVQAVAMLERVASSLTKL